MFEHQCPQSGSQIQSLGWEDPLGKEMATNSSTLAWKIPWMEDRPPPRPQGRKELDMTEQLDFIFTNEETNCPKVI